MCNATHGIEAGRGVIPHQGVSDGADRAIRPRWKYFFADAADLTLPLWNLHLHELVNLPQFQTNLRDCGVLHRIVKYSVRWLVFNIGIKESLADLHTPCVQVPVVGGHSH